MKRKTPSKPPVRILKGKAAGVLLEDIDSKLDLIVEKFEANDKRMDRMEERLDQIEARLDRIENEIVGIRILLGQHDDILKRHEEEIVKQALSH
ncbi:MAG: hypothetical protein HY073_05285 [Deltaproteobacteria bacterium]|nr:hypothetical protein [Deltaproteobacteria bacterium]